MLDGEIALNESDFQNYGPSGPNEPDDYNRYKAAAAKRTMATASLVCGIVALISFQLFFISLPMAGISIILALLSRSSKKIEGRALFALVAGCLAAVICSLYTVYAIRTVYNDPKLRAQVEQLYNYYSGQLSGTAESEEASQSEDPQEILSDILSGKYREEQKNGYSSDVPENGGAII